MAQTIFWCTSLDGIYISATTPSIKKLPQLLRVVAVVAAAIAATALPQPCPPLPLFNTPSNATHIISISISIVTAKTM